MWTEKSAVGVMSPAGAAEANSWPPSTASVSRPAWRLRTAWCHWPSLYEDVVRTSAYAVPVSIAARTAPRPGSARSQNWRTPEPIPYPQTIGRAPVVAVWRNQAVRVKSSAPRRSESEQETTRR